MNKANIQSVWGTATNATELPETRFAIQQDGSATLASAQANDQMLHQQRLMALDKVVQNDDLNLKAFIHHEAPVQKVGVDHHEDLDQRVLQYFGLKTGNGVEYFGWKKVEPRYSCYGE